MILDSLTKEQRLFALHPNEAFVQACPGSGKTRTILARIKNISETLPPRRGICVISFTNSAMEEFSDRSSIENLSYLLDHPGFMGTFDGFLRQFIFLPIGLPGCTVKPHVIDNWATLGIEIRLRGRNTFASGASLDVFDSEDGTADTSSLSSWKYAGLVNHIQQNRVDYERAARNRRNGLNRNGFVTSKQVRLISLQRIRDPDIGMAIGIALSARFQEIIIDEAQDCNPDDLEILTWLRSHGIKVTFVCDIDQSIYGFRNGFQTNLENFRNSYTNENRLTLVGNFRSSPPICSLSASLRINPQPDVSLGDYRDITHPVVILPYQNMDASIGQWFGEYIDRLNISRSKTMILAHSRNAGRIASGNAEEPPKGESKVESLARAISDFWTPGATKRLKKNAVTTIEKLLLSLTGRQLDDETHQETIKRLSIDQRLLRRQVFELIMKLPKTCEDNDEARILWVENARSIITSFNLDFAPRRSVRSALTMPRNGRWSAHLQRQEELTDLPYATIHQAKGREYPAVCVVIPEDGTPPYDRTSQLMRVWEDRTPDESKRVIYVGATRAQQVVVIAIPNNFVTRCVSVLNNSNVAHIVIRQ